VTGADPVLLFGAGVFGRESLCGGCVHRGSARADDAKQKIRGVIVLEKRIVP